MTDQKQLYIYRPEKPENWTAGDKKHVRFFKPEFAPKVADFSKRQTVRKIPKRPIFAGDFFDARRWAGVPYASKHVPLIVAPIIRVAGINIFEDAIALDGEWTDPEGFAIADGFDSFEAMKDFFVQEYNEVEFTGICTFWDPAS